MEKGFMHIYHGDGKGKTTAAVGLAIRAAGNEKKIIFAQFMKGRKSGEIEILSQIDAICVIRSEKEFGFFFQMTEKEKTELTSIQNSIVEQIWEKVKKEEVDLVILDEITYAYKWKLLDRRRVEQLVTERPDSIELVITGRDPDPLFLKYADYITCMKKERHPYENGIKARAGIEF